MQMNTDFDRPNEIQLISKYKFYMLFWSVNNNGIFVS